MAESNPELQAKLQELEHELEEGDITTKGSVNSVALKLPRSRSRRVARPRKALTSHTATRSAEQCCCRNIWGPSTQRN
jgi:hypothetical protein